MCIAEPFLKSRPALATMGPPKASKRENTLSSTQRRRRVEAGGAFVLRFTSAYSARRAGVAAGPNRETRAQILQSVGSRERGLHEV